MNFYAYIPREDGSKPVGSFDQMLITDLKTVKGAMQRIRRHPHWAHKPFVIQTFTNLYDEKTFRTVYTERF